MPFATENQKYGFKKEATRGIAEATPQKFLAVGAEALLDYKSLLIADDKIRGSKEVFPSATGIREGGGTLPAIDLEADTLGDLLLGCLGKVTTTQPDAINSPTVFKHTFKPDNRVQFPSFTYFVDRGLGIKRYPLTVIKKLTMAGSVDGKGQVAADVLFKTEETTSAFSAVFGTPKPLMFFQTEFKLDGVLSQDVKSWTLSIDNASAAHRTLSQSRDPKDIVSSGRFAIEGGYEIYFETEANRQKFLDNLPQAIDLALTGDIIEDAFKSKLELSIPKAKYTAYAFGTLEGLFGSAVAFQAELDPALGYSLQAVLTNGVTGY
ncbi:MAG: phage tail tube protein [Elusimicrobia bacterium]|nr:phage tail tube protein [Elusimicrobiota bacterium]